MGNHNKSLSYLKVGGRGIPQKFGRETDFYSRENQDGHRRTNSCSLGGRWACSFESIALA